jgi:hypothetical protein
MVQSLVLALSVADNKLSSRRGADRREAGAAAEIICSSIRSAAASGYRPSDSWLQQAWQLLQQALGIRAGRRGLSDALAEAQVGAAYATAVTFGFTSPELSEVMQSKAGKPPGWLETEYAWELYDYGDSWLQWLRVLAAPGVLAEPAAYNMCIELSKYYELPSGPTGRLPKPPGLKNDGPIRAPGDSQLEAAVTGASPQLQAEVLLVLGTPAMIEALSKDDSSGQLARAACLGLLGALAKGLSRAGDDSSSSSSSSSSTSSSSTSSSSSSKGGDPLSTVSTEVLLQLAAAMPVLLCSLAEAINSRCAWNSFRRLRPGHAEAEESDADKLPFVETERMVEAACKLVALAEHIAAYTSSISPAHASTAQLVQLDQALDAFEAALDSLAHVMEDKSFNSKFDFALFDAMEHAGDDLPQLADRQLFSLLAERLAKQQQPAADLVLAVAAGLAARCGSSSSPSAAESSSSSLVAVAALALKDAQMPDMSVQQIAAFMDAVVTVAECSPAAGDKDAVSSLVDSWRKQLPAYITPAVVAALEALPTEDVSAAAAQEARGAASSQKDPATATETRAAEAAVTEAKASAEAVAQILASIARLCLPVPSVAMELMQHLLPRLLVFVEPKRAGDVLSFVAQQQQRRFKA